MDTVMKSSPEARALLRAVRGGGRTGRRRRSYRDVARLLRLPNHGQAQLMLEGKLKDTPAMKAALKRADERAERAWHNVKSAPQDTVDKASLRVAIAELEHTLKYLKSLLPKP